MDIGAILRFRTQVEGAQQVTAYSRSLEQLQGKVANLAAGYLSVAGAQKAWDLAKQGAEINQTTESFERLNKQVWQTPDLLDEMSRAARGTVSEVELMQGLLKLTAGTSQELSTQFAAAAPQLLEISKAANKLNPALGDTAFLYDSISTGIKRSSPLILDNLGIVVKVGEANETYAKSLGKTVEALTAEEKQIALLNATLEAGGRLIEQVGGNVDSAADSYQRVEVHVKELYDILSTSAAITAAEEMGVLADQADHVADRYENAAQKVGDFFGRVVAGTAIGASDLITVLGGGDFAAATGLDIIGRQNVTAAEQAAAKAKFDEFLSNIWAGDPIAFLARGLEEAAAAQSDFLMARSGYGEMENAVAGVTDEVEGLGNATGRYFDGFQGHLRGTRDGLEGIAQSLRQAREEEAAATRERMLAWQEENQALGRAAVVSALGNLNSPEALVTPARSVSVTTGGLSSGEAALLKEYRDAAADAQQEISQLTYEIGVLGPEQGDLNKRLEEANGLLGHYNALMAPLAAVTGEVSTKQQDLAVNFDQLNKMMFQQAIDEGHSVETLIAVGLATGQLSEEQAEALRVTEALTVRSQILNEQVEAGALSADAAVTGLQHFATQLTNTADSAADVPPAVQTAKDAVDEWAGMEVPPVVLKVDNSEALQRLADAKKGVEDYGYTSYTAALDAQTAALLGEPVTHYGVMFDPDDTDLVNRQEEIERDQIETEVDLVPNSTEVDNEVTRLENYTVYVPVVFVPQNDPTPEEPPERPRPGGQWGGGPVTADQLYWVGEHGPELFVPDVGGYVVPNRHIGAGGAAAKGDYIYSPTINYYSNTREAAALVLAHADMERRRHFDRMMGSGR